MEGNHKLRPPQYHGKQGTLGAIKTGTHSKARLLSQTQHRGEPPHTRIPIRNKRQPI